MVVVTYANLTGLDKFLMYEGFFFFVGVRGDPGNRAKEYTEPI